MWQALKNYYKRSLTYGIGDGTMTTRERKHWIFMLWVLITGYSYYSVKDQVRSFEQGQFSLIEHFTGKPGPVKKFYDNLDAQIEEDLADLWTSLDSENALKNLAAIQDAVRPFSKE